MSNSVLAIALMLVYFQFSLPRLAVGNPRDEKSFIPCRRSPSNHAGEDSSTIPLNWDWYRSCFARA